MGKKKPKKQEKKNSKGSGQTSLKNDEGNPPAHSEQEKNDSVSPEFQSPELLECARIFDEKIRKIEDEIKSLKKESKDAQAKIGKLKSDRQQRKKTLKSEEGRLQKAEYEMSKLGDKFVYKSEAQTVPNDGGLGKMKKGKKEQEKKKKSGSVLSIPLPKEDFPTTGTLYAHKKERFMEISYKEEIEEGKQQAEYFKAKLVVKER